MGNPLSVCPGAKAADLAKKFDDSDAKRTRPMTKEKEGRVTVSNPGLTLFVFQG